MRGKIVAFFAILLLAGLSECTTTISEVGTDFFSNKSTFQISAVDSITVAVSTILWRDSLATSGNNNAGANKRLLVGYHNDPKLGTVTSQAVFQLGIPTVVPTLDKTTTQYIGLRLHLRKDGYSYYDTTHSQTISVYPLKGQLNRPSGVYYNTSKFTIDDGPPLGTLTFFPRPRHPQDSLEVPLSDTYGQLLMAMVYNTDVHFLNSVNFQKFLPGLAILPDSTSTSNFAGFATANAGAVAGTEMRLYYLDRTTTPVSTKYIKFSIGSNYYYNKIHSYRVGTDLESLKKGGDVVASKITDHESYLQCGTGLALKAEIPALYTLRSGSDPNFVCTRATLQFRASRDSYLTNPLPPTLVMYYVDRQNNYITTQPIGIRLYKDLEYGRNTSYSTDVTSFVNSQIPNVINTRNALLIRLDDTQFTSTVNRLYLGDQHSAYTMTLKLYYVSLPNEKN